MEDGQITDWDERIFIPDAGESGSERVAEPDAGDNGPPDIDIPVRRKA
jgi:hypothetical protein